MKIRFAHVEAGLRTGDLAAPFPEEFNRSVAGKVAHWHFCPTAQARDNLRAEGVPPARLFLTGNTGIDALRLSLARLPGRAEPAQGRRILLTAHRRENQGERMQAICAAVRALAERFADIHFVVPVHPNPVVKADVERMLANVPRVALTPPLGYAQLIDEMRRCHLILTDSGGIQEEAPFLRKPVLVLRDVTERPEAVELGLARLVGTDTRTIVAAASELLTSAAAYWRMASGASPYGDGFAAERIAAVLTGAGAPSDFET
jgi:UDP-N-acetylglucosamine 2-epimerase (non-hydrolysing)